MVLGARGKAVLRIALRVAVHVGALVPLGVLVAAYALDRLSVEPIREVTLRTGRTALVLLLLSLACTPLRLLGVAQAGPLRRPLGLYAAFYALLHFGVYALWDYRLQLDLIWLDLRYNRFLQIGLAALLIVIALAITSTRGWRRRLDRAWAWLHRLAYAAAALAVVHYFWAVKADRRVPLVYGGVLALLLLFRLPWVQRALARVRTSR
ncbi:MAG: sulfite oxidase heme-binding subunit YedZ [Anaerolineae bacterium]